ncbi:MAG: response regulator [Desulfobacteraceae bacterium]
MPGSGKADILVVDDDQAVLKMLSLIFTRKGYVTDLANSGHEAMEKLNTNRYRLVITDIKMPGISGTQILEYVKTEKQLHVPVVGMSGTPWLLQGEFDAVLSKPCTNEDLLKVIARTMRQSS